MTAQEPSPTTEPPSEYRYALRARPPGIGAIPTEGMIRVDPRPAENDPLHHIARHGFVVYNRPLTDQEQYQFELRKVPSVKEEQLLVEKVVGQMSSRRGAVIEAHSTMSEVQFASALIYLVENSLSRIASAPQPAIANLDNFAQRVYSALEALGPESATA